MRVRWDSRLKVMRVSTVAIIVSLILLLIFAGFTIYGNKVGNFVINVNKNSDVRLSLSTQADLSNQTERLAYSSVMELNDTSYCFLPEDIARQGLGNVSDMKESRYLAYSFYLINNSDRALDYDMELNLIDTVGDPLGMLRVMLIEEENDTYDESNRIYALTEPSPEQEEQLQESLQTLVPYRTEPFLLGEQKLFLISVRDFEAGTHRRYTVVIWLEGCDPDCNNAHMGERAKLQLDIKGY